MPRPTTRAHTSLDGLVASQLAVMGEKLNVLPDHEARIRSLETSKAKIIGRGDRRLSDHLGRGNLDRPDPHPPLEIR